MKTPRVQDFDPNAKAPELASPLDNMPVIQKPPENRSIFPQQSVHRAGEPVPPKKRVIKQRQPFDIYLDQYESLKQFSVEERMQGGIGSMSAMVREALDRFIAAKRKQKKGESI